ncbi:MAG: hypothetical protein IPJ07_11815 [Acidobacteria bacterium]|nr:hypothetical protein [Acidobacteriota bacterium]
MRRYATTFLVFMACCISLSCSLLKGTDVQSYVEEPFPEKLSDWRLFNAGSGPLQPNKGVIPYDLNTPLFSDHASKHRFVWMPAGASAVYNEDGPFEFPVGTVLSKSFAFPVDGSPGKEKLIETRLLVRGKDGWVSLPYVWNDEQSDAKLEIAGSSTEIARSDKNGRAMKVSYNIPNKNECAQCHDNAKTLMPIGPKARNLNRDYAYADGSFNQLDYWTRIGYLKGAPSSNQAPRIAVWNDPASGSLDARARAYLDNNCAHCHHPGGSAGYTGFLLTWKERDPRKLGYCKNPNSAGFSGNLAFDLVPGKPDESILIYRMLSTKPKEMMPEIGRSTIHQEGIDLIRDWISSLKGSCGDERTIAGK